MFGGTNLILGKSDSRVWFIKDLRGNCNHYKKKMKESQESADLVTFTEETLNGKLHFLYSEYYWFPGRRSRPYQYEQGTHSKEDIRKAFSWAVVGWKEARFIFDTHTN